MPEQADVLWLLDPADEAMTFDAGRRFWKELIREGRWTNPQAGFTLEVDRDRLEKWKRTFDEMCGAGMRVPVPWGHSYDPRDNAGFVEELELRDGALWGLLDVPAADDAEKLGKTVRGVSVSINPRFVDGSGRDFGEVIEHVALTNYPVVTDQGEFLQAAADVDPKGAITLELGDKAEPEPAADSSEPETRSPEVETRNSELTNRLYQLELERAESEVDEALRLGKFTRPAAEALRRLVAAGVERKYSFDQAGADGFDAAAVALDIIANTPPGAAVDMTEHTRLHPIPDPSGGAMNEARAARLAKENKALAGM